MNRWRSPLPCGVTQTEASVKVKTAHENSVSQPQWTPLNRYRPECEHGGWPHPRHEIVSRDNLGAQTLRDTPLLPTSRQVKAEAAWICHETNRMTGFFRSCSTDGVGWLSDGTKRVQTNTDQPVRRTRVSRARLPTNEVPALFNPGDQTHTLPWPGATTRIPPPTPDLPGNPIR